MSNLNYRQLCLIQTDVDPKFLSGLGKIRIMSTGIKCIGPGPSNLSGLDENPDYTCPDYAELPLLVK